MSLPPDIDTKIRQRFEDLLREAKELHAVMIEEAERKREDAVQKNIGIIGEFSVATTEFTSLRTRFLSLVHLLPSSAHLSKIIETTSELKSRVSSIKTLIGYIDGLKSDYESGMLQDLTKMVEANIASDYMGQAEQLLGEGIPGQYDHVPAAVLAGAVLEDALRRLCARRPQPISVNRPGGQPKTMGTLIDELKNASAFHELKAKQLRAWADIRNAAAHGRFDDFTRQDVERMIAGIQNFLADYL